MNKEILDKKLYRLTGILSIRLYQQAKRMDYCFTPYWKAPVNRLLKKPKVFEQAKLLNHYEEEEGNDFDPVVQG